MKIQHCALHIELMMVAKAFFYVFVRTKYFRDKVSRATTGIVKRTYPLLLFLSFPNLIWYVDTI